MPARATATKSTRLFTKPNWEKETVRDMPP